MAPHPSDAGRLVLAAPDRDAHPDALFDLLGRVFSDRGGYARWRDVCRDSWILPGHYDWATSRVGFLGDRLVTHFGVWNRRMRIGSALVRVAGVGGVATDGHHRRRGYMDRTARSAIAAMRDAGYHLSILFGIRDFYRRYGYVRAWPVVVYTVDLADLPDGGPRGRLRRFKPVARDDVARLYNRACRGLTGTAVRPTYSEGTLMAELEGYRWTDAAGRLRGYVIIDTRPKTFRCVEAVGPPVEVLGVLKRLARRRAWGEVTFQTLHDGSPLIRHLRQGNCRAETQYLRSGRAMVRTIHLASALEAMVGELGRRLAASPLAKWRGRLRVDDGREAVTLAIDRSRIRVASEGASNHAIRGGDEVAQLLIGTDDPETTVAAAGMELAGDAPHLVHVLFPRQDPMMSLRDRF